MAAKNGKNGFPEVEANINKISIINDQRLKPFVETFNIDPVNIVQQPLGSIFGFFKIKDATDDSAYIANFLTSVLKKEYFINPKRSVEDSFDAALNKVNIALSEIAKNGNIDWMSTFESAVCVIKDDMFYFAVTGTAKIMLLRDQYLSDISEGLSNDEGFSHPIKTFINVSSGTLKKRDKIIITSDELFRVLSETEIKKNSERFPQEKFVQFLRTALINELDSAEVFVIDVFEKKKEAAKKTSENAIPDDPNYFSAKSYERNKKVEKNSAFAESRPEYTDKQTGHIYVQGDKNVPQPENRIGEVLSDLAEKMGDFFSVVWKIILAGLVKLKKWAIARMAKKTTSSEEPAKTVAIQDKKASTGQAEKVLVAREYLVKFMNSTAAVFRKSFSKLRLISPNFSKIKDVFNNLSSRQKLIGIVILAMVVILPLLLSWDFPEENTQIQPETEIVPVSNREKLAGDKNIRFDFAISTIDNQKDVLAVEVVDSNIILLSQEKVILLKGTAPEEVFTIPEGQKIDLTCAMEDLKLAFLLTNENQLFSFSPVSKEFKKNQIDLPPGGNTKAISAYMTYLYVADSGTGNIRRYPRAEGGFGAGSDWLKESMNIKQVLDMAIDENIYLAFPDKITKFFKNQLVDFNFENSATSFIFSKIDVRPDFSNLYTLDSQNGRVITFSKEGMILAQYYDQKLEQAKDFAVDEKNNKVIVVLSDSSVIQFSL